MNDITEDFKLFGDTWIYCGQHLRVHKTGWCAVDTAWKINLGVDSEEEGEEKCRRLGLTLFDDVNSLGIKFSKIKNEI